MQVDTTEFIHGNGHVALVRLAGALDVETAPVVRTALLKALATGPALIVADVRELNAPEDVTLSLFPAAARHAAAWPGIPLVLADPTPPLRDALRRTAVCRYVPVFDSVDQACARADRSRPQRHVEKLPSSPQATVRARAFVAEVCERWGIGHCADVMELIVTELVSNVIRHVGGPCEVSLARRRRYLHLSVRDGSVEAPRPGANGGRGLMVVQAFTVAWGTTVVDNGKVVWATVHLP